MRGIPKVLKTKEDYLYLKENFPKEVWSPAFKALLEPCEEWFNKGEIMADKGVTDDTHKVETWEDKTYQYELVVSENPKRVALNWSVSDIENFLKDGE